MSEVDAMILELHLAASARGPDAEVAGKMAREVEKMRRKGYQLGHIKKRLAAMSAEDQRRKMYDP